MFPFDIEDDEIEISQDEEKIPTDYEIDFITGKLTGRKITGVEAIIQWIKIVLSTDRYFFTQYSWNHGAELNSLIGKNYSIDYVRSEAKRMIEEAILVDENILGIENFQCDLVRDRLTVSFKVNTVYGGGEVDV